ncbi:MAG: hypothetical protein ACLPKB_08360 [Xanthobacteraceae bacterium]
MTITVRRKQAPSLACATGRKQKDREFVRKVELHITTVCLLRGDNEKSIAVIHPGSRILIPDKETGKSFVLQTETVIV